MLHVNALEQNEQQVNQMIQKVLPQQVILILILIPLAGAVTVSKARDPIAYAQHSDIQVQEGMCGSRTAEQVELVFSLCV